MFEIERDLLDKGYKYIVGVDEAGRGALCGDVVAAAVCIDIEDYIEGVKDSKKISEKKRELFYDEIAEKAFGYGIGRSDSKRVDEINIKNATKEAMFDAIENCKKNLIEKGISPDIVLVDAEEIKNDTETVSVIKGDQLCYTISCASIMAKVFRDRLCIKWHEEYPAYNIGKHKGYGTKEHRGAIYELGPSPIHRKTFIKNVANWKI
ncbi:MAG: ribonuclease HII [Tissierellia bacterium]|nr:ribonuclease HII [Tissierellia bacterium]